jgi:hypothetical protein
MRFFCYLLAVGLGAVACANGNNPPAYDAVVRDYKRAPDLLACQGNNNGEISLDELTFAIGTPVSYRVNRPFTVVDVDVAGIGGGNERRWTFDAIADSKLFTLSLEDPAGSWYASYFPNASFATPIDVQNDTLQVLELTRNDLRLLGVASRKADYTLLVYDKPITLFRFPLKVGDQYSATSTVTDGRLDGLPIATEDTYVVRIDARGDVKLPELDVKGVLRVRVDVTSKALGGVKASTRQVQFFRECFGEVARAVSQIDEPNADFTKAAELRLLAF